MSIAIRPGMRFEGWTVLHLMGAMGGHPAKVWWCRCKCGRESGVREDKLKGKRSKHCTACTDELRKRLRYESQQRRIRYEVARNLKRAAASRLEETERGHYIPTQEEIRVECLKIREEQGHVFVERFCHSPHP